MTQVHSAGVVSEIVDRVCHKEQIGIWANEMATALSLSDFLKEDWTFDDTVDLEKEIEAQLLDIIKSALTHPGYDVAAVIAAQDAALRLALPVLEQEAEQRLLSGDEAYIAPAIDAANTARTALNQIREVK